MKLTINDNTVTCISSFEIYDFIRQIPQDIINAYADEYFQQKTLFDFDREDIVYHLRYHLNIDESDLFYEIGFSQSFIEGLVEQHTPKGYEAICDAVGLNYMATYEELCAAMKNKFFKGL
ncbi:MAG: hypothetical protein LBU90_03810 [Bacteroidales bacterium]|jgi:hypothetical protein|nr:hypothetical protein [Bacteroidales bacterium]